ncbi:hypothetical protein ACET3Z_017873 [Daucus carota]
MADNGTPYFIEWREEIVSKEWGNRVVHYYLKDVEGESVLAVVGTERSVRHMFYVVSDQFLSAYGAENSVYAGYKWRARREVVNWLTSMLSKQHQLESSQGDPISAIQQIRMPVFKGCHSRNLKVHNSGIEWSGESWACGKQLKHYPAFRKNGITIAIQSFVFVMAEEENHHLAYLEDLYEDRKGQKKVKVRWFHLNQEVKNVDSIQNSHPKEVFMTPYVQVISVECVDGPAIVVTREHYDKFVAVLPQDVLDKVHLCFRQFKSNRVKPFKLNKLCGYFNQPIFSYLGHEMDDDESKPRDNVKLGSKRTRSCRDRQPLSYKSSGRNWRYGVQRKLIHSKRAECPPLATTLFKVNDKIELLCQDSGIRGCWFRCTILKVSRHMIRVQYDDLNDADGCSNLEEWIPAFRPALPDKLGMRHKGRPTIRPALSCIESHLDLVAGAAVDAWWSDGWWEGVLIGIGNSEDGILQIFVPSENLFLNVHGKNLRASRDWVGDCWLDVEANGNIVSAISVANISDDKISTRYAFDEAKSDDFPALGRTDLINSVKITNEEKLELDCLAPQDSCPELKVNIACSSLQDVILEKMNCADELELQLKDVGKKSNESITDKCDGMDDADRTHDHSGDITVQNVCDDNNVLLIKDSNDNSIAPEESENSERKPEPALMEVDHFQRVSPIVIGM